MRFMGKVVAAGCVLALSGSAGWAFWPKESSLQGLGAFSVLVERFDQDAHGTGLSVESLREHIELRLRQYGLPVTSAETYQYLYVNVNLIRTSNGHHVYAVSVGLHDSVYLARNANEGIAETWSKGGVGICSSLNTYRQVYEMVDGALESFANDYFKANPRR